MIEKFNGIIYLIVFIVHFLGYAVYAYRCVFGTKDFCDPYAMDHTRAIMVRFFGIPYSFCASSFVYNVR